MNNTARQTIASQANTLARSYSPLLYFKKLKELLESTFVGVDFSSHDKYSLHQQISRFLSVNYLGEELVKYQIAKKYLLKDTVGAFEIKVGNSRADFASINGVSRCYEIKTKLDNLNKLEKQAKDYTSVFEYNTVLLDQRHLLQALKDLPVEYGVMLIEKQGLKLYRRATKNPHICSSCQLDMLTAKELSIFFGRDAKSRGSILEKYSPGKINTLFKKALKRRYQTKWEFVRTYHEQILPIDFQFFFSTQESPSLLYQRDFKALPA